MNLAARVLKKPVTSSIIAVLVGFIVASAVLASAGYNPLEAFVVLFQGALGRPKYVSNLLIKATPILLTGVAIAFAYKAGLFNIGAEGQYIMGTVCATVTGIMLDLPAPLQIPLVLLVGILGGALAGSLVGWLKAKFGIHEVITSIMINWISLYLCNFVVNSATFHSPNSTATHQIHESSFTMILPNWKTSPEGIAFLDQFLPLKEFLLKTDVNIGIVVAILAAFVIGWLLMKTKVGYEIRAVGLNKDAARFAGISVEKNLVLCMLISGGLCGLAGALMITGTAPHAISTLAAFENNGFNGLSVAFIAGSSAVGCIPAALLFAGLLYGGQSVQQLMGAPSEIINIMIGTIVFFVALGNLVPMLLEKYEHKRALVALEAEAFAKAEAAHKAVVAHELPSLHGLGATDESSTSRASSVPHESRVAEEQGGDVQ